MNDMKPYCLVACVAAALVLSAPGARAVVTVSVWDSSAPWLGYMNVSNLPSEGGGFVFGQGWGVPDLTATFNDGASAVVLGPNTVPDPDPFWYQGGGGPGAPGNKIMEANLFIEETGPLAGETVIFSGSVLGFSLTSAHQVKVFIRDFAPDFSSFTESSQPITGAGDFSISLDTINDPTRHVQYGFQMRGENVWITDVAPFGTVTIATVPEPSALLLGLSGLALLARRKR